MADTKISQLDAATPAAGDFVPGVKGGQNKVFDTSDIGALGIGNSGHNDKYWTAFAATVSSTFTLSAGRVYYLPFVVGKRTTFTRIGINVTTGSAASQARLGIYRMESGVPTSRILDAGVVDTATTGEKEITITQDLAPGFYCLAVISDAAIAASRAFFSANFVGHLLGWVDGAGTTNFVQYETGSGITLPAVATVTGRDGIFAPSVWLRAV